jgi:hypothetical protein
MTTNASGTALIEEVSDGIIEQAQDGISFFLAQAYIALTKILHSDGARAEMETCIDQMQQVHSILIDDGPAAALMELKHLGVPPFRTFPGSENL